ncbi:Structural maintenance of chromosomes protein 5 [Coemansia sp. RSA 1646]|nr:Structural maintenance of chromosomes protein 5 [Coemansia sp. RSA 1646]KAJ2086785.1 Structural maintenance of chromosomes protein 5 [Coemansia sp. RSA 986]
MSTLRGRTPRSTKNSAAMRAIQKSEPNGGAQAKRNKHTMDSEESEEEYETPNVPTQIDQDGYRVGSIMRISLHNFVTYSEIEITPGPNMNMIIGPNGTGKSTIVCAIALGLGEKPSLLGRSTTLSEFVKHGCDQGSIELTLAGRQGPITIGREIVRENNKSHWKLNGRPAPFSEVQKTTRALNIQVNNLCQFLPQDRVVEFSKMSIQELLKETQCAVGRDDLLELQRELIKLRAEERGIMGEIQRGTHDADNMRKQNDVLERDVKRWQERQKAESQMRMLEALIPVMKYKEAKAEHDGAKVTRNQAHAQYQQLKNDSGPAEDEMQELESSIARTEAKRQRLQTERADSEKKMRKQLKSLEDFEKKQHDLNSDLDDLKKRAQRRRENIAQLRAEVARLEAAHPESAPEGESDETRQLAAELREMKLQMNGEIVALQDEQKELMRAGREANREIEARDQRLRSLDDVLARKRDALRSASYDSFRALEWLEANRDQFSQHVFAPICLEVSVRDAPQYASLVETVVSMSSLRTFVTQSDDDYRVFTRQVNDKQKLRVDVVSYHKDLDEFHPPQPREVLHKLGFDGYVLDFIEAPRKVLAALCNRDKIHEIPVARGPVNHELIESKMLFKEYIADGTRFTITRGRYGSRAATVTTSRVRAQARILSSGETDEVRATRERLHDEISMFRDQLRSNEEKMKLLSRKDKNARDKHRNADAREKELKEERKRLAEQIGKWQRNQIHVETKRAQLDTMVADEQRETRGGGQSQTARDRKRIEQAIRQNSIDRADSVCEMAAAVGKQGELVHQLTVVSLEGFRDMHALSELKAQAVRQREAISEALLAYEEAVSAFEAAKVAARECLAETRRVTEEMSDDERMRVRMAQDERSNATAAELEVELHTCRQRLSMASNSGLSARVMEQYEERQARLATMVSTLQQREHQLLKVRKKKLRVRGKWEQPLDELVRKISERFTAMFDSIGCMGEVHLCRAGDGIVAAAAAVPELATQNGDGVVVAAAAAAAADDEDYNNWGIEIRVAFRRNEQLHALDNHRQSGGERAVSTILYLQSLQTLAAAPFRVVDEINQGMDQRNERLVHRLIVDTACRAGSPQYFLITPKLLQDLEYHPMMRVLCIYNGEWQPESFNFNRYITNARRSTVAT